MASRKATKATRRAAIAGAVALGTMIAPAAPALADSITVPGVGTFELPPGVPASVIPPQLLAPIAPTPSTGDRALAAARTKVGAPYVWGATGPNAFDCSGLVQWAYRQAGISLPRTSQAQLGSGRPVAIKDLRPGDLVSYNGGGHSALYAGDGKILHASTSGSPVKYAPLNVMSIAGARRF